MVLSLGPRQLRVPDLTGLAPRAAALKLVARVARARPGVLVSGPGRSAGILAQDPEPETPAIQGRGRAGADEPRRSGEPHRDAGLRRQGRARRSGRGWRSSASASAARASRPTRACRPNTILKQFPPAGYPLSSREVVSLTVSRPPEARRRAPVMSVRIAPSLLSADFARLADALAMAEAGGADLVHVDVMDGHFVPNLTIGPPVVRALRKATRLPLDVHLMIEQPEATLPEYLDAGADWISVHVEATHHLQRCLDAIRRGGAKAGAAINPATPTLALSAAWPDLDYAVVMSVNPGWGGQPFLAPVGREGPSSARRGAGRRVAPRHRGRRRRRPANAGRSRGPARKYWSPERRFTEPRIPAAAIGQLRDAARLRFGSDRMPMRERISAPAR